MSKNGVLTVAAVTPRVWLADPAKNAEEIISLACEAAAVGADIIVFPEMSVTGSTCGDLFKQSLLLDAAQKAAESVAKALPSLDATVVIGLPVPSEGGFSSGAAIIKRGRFVGSDSRFLLVTGDRIPEDLPEGTSLVLHLAAVPELVTRHAVRKRTLAGLTYRTGAAYV